MKTSSREDNKADQRRCEQMKYRDFEEKRSISEATPLTSRCSATVILFFQLWEDTTTTKDSSNPTSVPELLHTSLVSQARETQPGRSFVFVSTLILIETVVCVVWYKEESSTQLAVSSQEDPLSKLPCLPSWWDRIPHQ